MSIDGNKRHETAQFMRQLGEHGIDFNVYNIEAAIGSDHCDDGLSWERLADLIDAPVVREVRD